MTEKTARSDPIRPTDVTAGNPITIPGFFDALTEGRLLGVRCERCGEVMIPPRPACYACGSRSVVITDQPFEGTIVSYTIIHRPLSAFVDRAPFPLAIVELDSGARLTGRVNAAPTAVDIGAPVRLVVETPAEPERATELSYEAEWPIHAFELA